MKSFVGSVVTKTRATKEKITKVKNIVKQHKTVEYRCATCGILITTGRKHFINGKWYDDEHINAVLIKLKIL